MLWAEKGLAESDAAQRREPERVRTPQAYSLYLGSGNPCVQPRRACFVSCFTDRTSSTLSPGCRREVGDGHPVSRVSRLQKRNNWPPEARGGELAKSAHRAHFHGDQLKTESFVSIKPKCYPKDRGCHGNSFKANVVVTLENNLFFSDDN